MTVTTGVRDVFARVYDIFETGDSRLIDPLLWPSGDLLVIGTDPQEWWEGDARVGEVLRAQLEEIRTSGMRVQPGARQQVVERGDTGWGAEDVNLVMPDGQVLPARLTLVCVREGGEWRVAHWHMSFGVANDTALGQELTI
ncbi:nuclear transport factor 2 family protein [Deinococcus apachensis]|uniref:nuclear transport factor 2 family protein n=1 Tax=Deinococcus apachensis TaxID=309886 RepID=UPI00037968C9|nr:nuclear transport factor 2 family protein [Deinococcus apachensis]